MKASSYTVAGIDIGGMKKGFHAVALREHQIAATLATRSAADVVSWCRQQEACVVGIDAPCKWSLGGQARPCERELAGLGMSAFYTPSQAVGQVHPFYSWMLNGAELFRLLAPHYRLYDGRSPVSDRLCFETFPQAIACVLAGRRVSAMNKRVDRRNLLARAEIATESLTNIDEIDAALCALAAEHVLAGSFKAYGDAAEGFILVPGR
jgi:predicted nuclease with RNAse H fold